VLIELEPRLLKFTKFKSLLLSVGESIRWAGVLVVWLTLFFCKLFQKVLDVEVCSLALEYLTEFPTSDEYEGFTL
jgi:hypothetical protein